MARKGKTDSKDALGEVIQAGRARMRLTRDELAELVDLSPRYILSIENEKKKPAFHTLCKLIRTLGIRADDIFYPGLAADENTSVQRLVRMLSQCDEREIKAVTALVETLLHEKK